MNIDELFEKFFQTEVCKMCGTQRCERTPEWAEGCPKWKAFLTLYAGMTALEKSS